MKKEEKKKADFIDPDLQLITSSRVVTLQDIARQEFNGARQFIMHRMVFQKKFTELLKVFKSGIVSPELVN